MADKKFLNDVYELSSVEDTRKLYDAWSESYDAEIQENGYATPKRVAAALAHYLPDRDAAVLDFGCGTGMSGVALKTVGFTNIDGCDLSPDMLEQARKKQVYRKTWQADPDGKMQPRPGDYCAITAVGVISKGAAPPETLDRLIDLLSPGGFLVFSFNDHTFEDPRFEARVNAHIEKGTCQQLFRQNGPHLPGIDLSSTVFVLERL